MNLASVEKVSQELNIPISHIKKAMHEGHFEYVNAGTDRAPVYLFDLNEVAQYFQNNSGQENGKKIDFLWDLRDKIENRAVLIAEIKSISGQLNDAERSNRFNSARTYQEWKDKAEQARRIKYDQLATIDDELDDLSKNPAILIEMSFRVFELQDQLRDARIQIENLREQLTDYGVTF